MVVVVGGGGGGGGGRGVDTDDKNLISLLIKIR